MTGDRATERDAAPREEDKDKPAVKRQEEAPKKTADEVFPPGKPDGANK